ncbi:hypothetical protein HanOQP8_Chr04g0135111 [Helianthus annuus]|nr:hypothetical protein HanLR1_Chr04g0126941 [Helianthus annuus]KAJ0760180.1 hypothetical protein HanOQP8_Chr04g0135111 [Helianthus annuus]
MRVGRQNKKNGVHYNADWNVEYMAFLKQLSIQPEESESGECCRGAKKVGVPWDKKKQSKAQALTWEKWRMFDLNCCDFGYLFTMFVSGVRDNMLSQILFN